jgi:hypothetical protein
MVNLTLNNGRFIKLVLASNRLLSGVLWNNIVKYDL